MTRSMAVVPLKASRLYGRLQWSECRGQCSGDGWDIHARFSVVGALGCDLSCEASQLFFPIPHSDPNFLKHVHLSQPISGLQPKSHFSTL